jgi:hypothetical protein
MVSTRKFGSPEIGVKFKCDVHPWMGAWVCVVSHPYYQVTGADGAFEIRMLPPGHYTLEVWHERYGNGNETKPLTKEVHLSEKASVDIDFTFEEP